jgi:DNA repair exonuclease SbcCD ATPase subunit
MRNIQFEEVGMENYGPYTDPMILTFENDKLVLVTGPNGIGKTMAIDAIPFTLYGITSKGAKGDDVVNNSVGRNCKTWVKFKVNDEQYIVTRYHKYTKYNNTVILNQNGVDIKQGHREVLPHIERIVCPQQAFMNALMFGQKVKDFFTDLVDSKKKEIFRKLLDLEMFLTYYKNADVALKKLAEENAEMRNNLQIKAGLVEDAIEQIKLLTAAKNNFYNNREEQINQLENKLASSLRLLSKWQKDLEEARKQDTNLEDTIIELANIKKEIESISEDDAQAIKDIETSASSKTMELRAKAQEATSEVNQRMNDEVTKIREKCADIKQETSTVIDEYKEEIHTYELEKIQQKGKIESLNARINEIQTKVLDSDVSECPLCEQSVDEHTTNTLIDKVNDYQNEITVCNQRMYELDEVIKVVNIKIEHVRETADSQLKDLQSDERSWKRASQDKLEEIQRRLSEAIQKVKATVSIKTKEILDASAIKTDALTKREKELQDLRKTQEENLSAIKHAEDTISGLERDQIEIEKEIKTLETAEYDESQLNNYKAKEVQLKREIEEGVDKLEKNSSLMEIAQFWKTGFSSSGMPSMLIDEAIPFMNERVEYYLDKLTNGRYVVSFDTLAETKAGEFRDKISVHVLDTQTRANSRVQLSGGQTRIIDIAIILTLGDLLSNIQNVTFNILLFDEIFDALDEQNIQYVSRVLSKIKIGKAVYIISHQHQDHLEADETLSFT